MAAAKKTGPPADKVMLYDKLLATIPEIERKGAANLYTSMNGNMYTLLQPGGQLAVRLPEDARQEFLKQYKARLFEAYGVVMKEYVAVPEDLLKNTKELKKYLALSYNYAKTLKAKPATRKKP